MAHPTQEVELRQLEPDEERLVLALRTQLLHLVVTDLEAQVILVRAARSVAQRQVAAAHRIQQRHQARPALEVRSIVDRHPFAVHRNLAVELLEDWNEVVHKLPAGGIDLLAIEVHLLLAGLVEQGVRAWRVLLQQAVAL